LPCARHGSLPASPAPDPEPLPLLDPVPLLDPELVPLLDPDALPEDDDALSAAASGLPVPPLELEQLAEAPVPAAMERRMRIDRVSMECMSADCTPPEAAHAVSLPARRAMAAPHPMQARTSTTTPAGQVLTHAPSSTLVSVLTVGSARHASAAHECPQRAHRTLPVGVCVCASACIAAALTIPAPPCHL
jgi:hypothetical protein